MTITSPIAKHKPQKIRVLDMTLYCHWDYLGTERKAVDQSVFGFKIEVVLLTAISRITSKNQSN